MISKKDQRGRRASQNIRETVLTETRVLNKTHRELVADGQSRTEKRTNRVRGLRFFKEEKCKEHEQVQMKRELGK